MICYRDMTFCKESECAKFKDCFRAYTAEVKHSASLWWGGDDAPVALFINKPGCFESKEVEDEV